MITHVVLFKLRENDEASVAEAAEMLLGLEGQVPSLGEIEVGRDIVGSGRSYDIALITRFDDMAALEAYRVHPNHLPVLDYMGRNAAATVAVDFES